MPYHLELTDDLPKDLTGIFNPNVLSYSGVLFRNEVPIMKPYRQYFKQIKLVEYLDRIKGVTTAINGDNRLKKHL